MPHHVFERIAQSEVAQLKQGTPEWLESRKAYPVTGSVAAAILGCDPYKTRRKAATDKAGHGVQGQTVSFNTAHGHAHEGEAVRRFIAATGQQVLHCGLVPHAALDFIAVSPDGITADGELLEVKCPVSRRITDAVPAHYMPQLQLSMETLDLEWANYVEYKPGNEFRDTEFQIIRVKRDRQWFAASLPSFESFSKEVRALQRLPPPPIMVPRKRRLTKTRLGSVSKIGYILSTCK